MRRHLGLVLAIATVLGAGNLRGGDPDRLRQRAFRTVCCDRSPLPSRGRGRGRTAEPGRGAARPIRSGDYCRRCLRRRTGRRGRAGAGRCRRRLRGRPSLLAFLVGGGRGLRGGRRTDADDHLQPPAADRGGPRQRLPADRPRRPPGPNRRRFPGRAVATRQDCHPGRRQHLRRRPGRPDPAPAARARRARGPRRRICTRGERLLGTGREIAACRDRGGLRRWLRARRGADRAHRPPAGR